MGQGKFTSVYTNDRKFCLFNRPIKQVAAAAAAQN